MDGESEKRDSPFLDQTILRAGDKQDQFPTQADEVTTPLMQFTQNIMGTMQKPCRLRRPLNKCPYSLISIYPMERGQG